MKKRANTVHRIKTLIELHERLGVAKPMHPLVSVINNSNNTVATENMPKSFSLDFYKITFEPNLSGKSIIKYGQQLLDFNDGGLFFLSPNQVVTSIEEDIDHTGFALLIHPNIFQGHTLATKIKRYNFFSYAVNEALHLSDKEKNMIVSLFLAIEEELSNRIDEYSQDVILSQIELFLNYANRFYKRQFITRKAINSNLLQKFEILIDDYFESGKTLTSGTPTVKYFADKLFISPGYLSDMMRSLLGINAQQYIQDKLISMAKEKLSSTELSISEISFKLGFEHSQSFSKFFKTKTKLTPLQFRQSFN
ncbi:AraC family transcriptional regulator [Flavobacterium sp. J27]|uniref:helix-turn-helix domain-containing protein n=1 Tax=Flavobacterium sp. J27 TaxID=2060419 RepID=UPI001030CDB4|nr:helix-turn-helix transcriptional regulator [Flavobacterium sp. J27]